jgi:hypothetical protein
MVKNRVSKFEWESKFWVRREALLITFSKQMTFSFQIEFKDV